MNGNLKRMVEIASDWEDMRGRGDRGLVNAEGYTMVSMLDELRDLIRAAEDSDDIVEENFGESCLTVYERN